MDGRFIVECGIELLKLALRCFWWIRFCLSAVETFSGEILKIFLFVMFIWFLCCWNFSNYWIGVFSYYLEFHSFRYSKILSFNYLLYNFDDIDTVNFFILVILLHKLFSKFKHQNRLKHSFCRESSNWILEETRVCL